VGAGFAAHHVVPDGPLVRGVLIGDRFAPDHGSAAEWLAARGDSIRSRVVRFRHEDQHFEATLGEVGVRIDVAATLERAEAIGHQGTLYRRMREAREAREGKIDVPLVWFIDQSRAKAFLQGIGERVYQAPVDAKLDMRRRIKVPDVLGKTLDIDASMQALAAGTHEDEETIDLAMRYVSAKTTIADLVAVDIEKVVHAYETTFTTWGTGSGRAVNIRHRQTQRAAAIFDSIVSPRDDRPAISRE